MEIIRDSDKNSIHVVVLNPKTMKIEEYISELNLSTMQGKRYIPVKKEGMITKLKLDKNGDFETENVDLTGCIVYDRSENKILNK